jgi:hypothetical protein
MSEGRGDKIATGYLSLLRDIGVAFKGPGGTQPGWKNRFGEDFQQISSGFRFNGCSGRVTLGYIIALSKLDPALPDGYLKAIVGLKIEGVLN